MTDVFAYLLGHWDQVLAAAAAVVAAASAVAALTPTPTDDGWVRRAYRLLDAIALNIGHAKEK